MNQRHLKLPPESCMYDRHGNFASGRPETRVSWDTGNTAETVPQAAHMNEQTRSAGSLRGANVMGVDFTELISRVMSFKEEWAGDLGSSLFFDKEQEGQAIFAFALVAVYMLIKMFMGSTSGLIVSVGLFLAGGRLTKHPSKAGSGAPGTAQIIELDRPKPSPFPSRKTVPGYAPSSLDHNTGRRQKSLLEEAVEELRNTHRSAGISTSSSSFGSSVRRPVESILEQEQRRHRQRHAQSSGMVEQGEGAGDGDEYLASEFPHHRKAPLRSGANISNMDVIGDNLDDIPETEPPRHPKYRKDGAAAMATARRNRKSRVMRVQIKPREDVINLDNIILR